MATPEDIALVRLFADEPTQDNWDDATISSSIDDVGVDSTVLTIWREKQARFSKLVDVSEAGASRKMSQAFAHAEKMSAYWSGIVGVEGDVSGARVHKIVRS